MEVVPLQYADVSEVVGILVPGNQIAANDTFSPQQQSFGSSGLSSGSIGVPASPTQPQALSSFIPGGLTATNSLGQQITPNISVDRRLNAIILRGTPEVIGELKAEITKIDIPLESVILDTEVVELDDSSAHDLGIDFTSANGQVAAVAYQSKSQTAAQGSATLQAAVYAEVVKGHGKLLARPRIVAQNGASAQIITGQALPIVTSIAVSGVNAVSQQVQYVNVGVSLQIQPRITADGYVTSHVYAEVSSVTGSQQGYPTLSQRSATTAATVRDGESYIIGGLYQEDDIRSLGKTPLLGDLPLIGGMFRVRNDTYALTNLYIIVTPHIIRNRSNPPGADVPK
jgi:general secretion pathway protein D